MQNKSGLDVTQAAEDWAERGVYTVPLHAGSKRPIGTGWQKLRLATHDFGKHFKRGNNIGALWGEDSNWATDLDLDLETASLVAPHILNHYLGDDETFVYGRRNKPMSHYIFRCVGSETKKWQVQGPEELGMVVEIRSTGAQSVVPPSKHPDGDRYYIETDADFYDISRRDLEAIADEVSIAALMLHYYPGGKGRHDYIHACTGSLCHAKWKEEKILRVMAAVLSEVEDEELHSDRIGAVRNTLEKALDDKKNRIRGLTTLEQFMSARAVTALRGWLKHGTQEAQLEIPAKKRRPVKENLEFNPDWLKVGGLVGDVTKWVGNRSYVVQPVFDLAAGLMCTALATCNHYIVDNWDTTLGPYMMVTAPTGGGKESPISAVTEFARKLELLDYVAQSFQSYFALLDQLTEDPNMMCLVWDEAARALASAKDARGQQFQIITHLISLFGAGNKVVAGSPGRNNPIPTLENPFVLVLATAQPDKLMEALTSEAQETGFVNRFILFDAGFQHPQINRNRSKVFPAAIRRQALMLRSHEPHDGEFTRIPFRDTKSFTMFTDFEEMSRRRSMYDSTWARANQNALMLAGIVAVGLDPHRPEIDQDTANWAIEVTSWSCYNWDEKVRLTGGGTQHEKDSFRVEKMIRYPERYLSLAKHPSQHKQLKMLQEGFMHPAVLQRGCRSMPSYKLEEILDQLTEMNLIGQTDRGGVVVYFHKGD